MENGRVLARGPSCWAAGIAVDKLGIIYVSAGEWTGFSYGLWLLWPFLWSI